MITDERIAAYIESMEAPLPWPLKEIEAEALKNFVPIIKKPARELLRHLIRLKNPESILEVGTAVGFSAIYMNSFQGGEGTIDTIEKMPERICTAKRNIQRAGREQRITLLEGDAAQLLKELLAQGKTYDMIFMDAAKGQYLLFLEEIQKLLKKGGYLISDNVLQEGQIAESRYAIPRRDRTIHGRMREYLYVLTHTEGWDTVILPVGDGIALTLML